MQWHPIKTVPKNNIIDIWSKTHGRCADYVRVDYKNDGKNIFYAPVRSGICTIRDATHWMIIEKPKGSKNE
jgi:hypothetical protein